MTKQFFTALKAIFAFLLIWVILLALSPFFIVFLCAKYALEILNNNKKTLDAPKTMAYVPATTDNNIHSAN